MCGISSSDIHVYLSLSLTHTHQSHKHPSRYFLCSSIFLSYLVMPAQFVKICRWRLILINFFEVIWKVEDTETFGQRCSS